MVLSIITLGLGAAMVSEYAYNRPNFVVACSVLSILYLAALLIPQVLIYIPVVAVVAGDILFTILWLACFACIADVYGSLSCDGYSYGGYYWSYWGDSCKEGKAVIAMGVIMFLLFIVTTGLVIFYSLLPSLKSKSYMKGGFSFGGIFLSTASGPVGTEEAEIGTGPEPVAALADPEPMVTDSETVPEKIEEPVSSSDNVEEAK